MEKRRNTLEYSYSGILFNNKGQQISDRYDNLDKSQKKITLNEGNCPQNSTQYPEQEKPVYYLKYFLEKQKQVVQANNPSIQQVKTLNIRKEFKISFNYSINSVHD